jgi:methylmalonyl-CoA mutase
MAGKPIVELLRETFPASSPEDWKRAASQEIEGQNPLVRLAWKNADELTFLPYYDEADVATLFFQKKFQLQPSTEAYTQPRHWLNLTPVFVTNAVTANAKALDHLRQGADGIFFDLSVETSYTPEALLQSIEWPYCAISFRVRELSFLQDLANYIVAGEYEANTLAGSIFWNSTTTAPDIFPEIFHTQKKISLLGVYIASSTPATEISAALIEGVKRFALATEKKIPAASNIAFSLPMENNFLMNIAKLKALRMLWFQVVRAHGDRDFSPDQLQIHCRCEPWVDEKFQPHGNMLSGTISSLAAIAGGCNALAVYPEDGDNITMSRIARNIAAVLREESHLDKVSDPLAGAYALQVMVDDLAKKAWMLFQSDVQKI